MTKAQEYGKEWYQRNKAATKARSDKRYQGNKEAINKRSSEYYKNNKDKFTGTRWAEQGINLTVEQYEYMVMCAGGCCEICGDHLSESPTALAVDHDHETGEVRGLLCRGCNLGIGNLRDDADQCIEAAGYLTLVKGTITIS